MVQKVQEECVVKELKNGFAYIELSKAGACDGCKACVFGKNKDNSVQAMMDVECKVGDSVVVELPAEEIKFGFLFAYLLPIIGLIAGIFIGHLLKSDALSVILALFLCVFSFFGVHLIDKQYKKRKYMPIVVKVIKKD